MPDRTRPKALLLGSIGTLAETSDIQCAAFNRAFREAGLDWHWDFDMYLRMLTRPGGARRIEDYAAERGQRVDAASLHAAKVRAFAEAVGHGGLSPRPGIVELLSAARASGIVTAFVTATGADTVALILRGLAPTITRQDFDFVGQRDLVAEGKPAPDIYEAALQALGVHPSEAVAIEDTPESAEAAKAAGVTVYAYPGLAARDRAFPGVMAVLDRPDPARLLALDPSAQAPAVMQ